jgi:carotenoid cleavage dioxygenase-like enzyme
MRVMEDGDLETVGGKEFHNKSTEFFTAHPKIDPVTGFANPSLYSL